MKQQRTILQVPLSPALKKSSEDAAEEAGFSSLQEAIRIFLTRFAKKEIRFEFADEPELSEKAKRRYAKMIDEINSGKVKTIPFTTMNDFLSHLES